MDAIDWVRQKKAGFDRIVEPIILYAAGNAAALTVLNEGLQAGQHLPEQWQGTYGLGLHIAAGAALIPWNTKVLPKIDEKALRRHHRWQDRQPRQGILSFLKTAALGAGIALAAPHAAQDAEELLTYHGGAPTLEEVAQSLADAIPRRATQPQPVRVNGLEGHSLNDLYTSYTGIAGTVTGTEQIDFAAQLRSLWERKDARTDNPVVDRMIAERVSEYHPNSATKTDINGYISTIHEAMEDVRRNIDWDALARIQRVEGERATLLRDISHSLDASDMLAYSLTELMPEHDGAKNLAVMDFLLKNAGEEYVQLLPALYDDYVSFGPYQFTQFAIFDTGDRREGASITNQALPSSLRIPGSVMYLEGADHHKAAYLFAMHNIGGLVRNLDDDQVGTLRRVWQDSHDDIVSYIAAAHHAPTHARSSAKRWLDNDAELPFVVSCAPSRVLQYCKKTAANYDALH